MNILGKRIRYLREKNKLSQKLFAEKIGITNSQLSRYELGERKPDPEMISQIADFFNVSADYLLGRSDFENPVGKKSDNNDYDSLDEITKLVKEYGIEQIGFFDIEEWKNLTPEDVEDIRKHFEWVAEKAKQRNKEEK
ncbi:helix-turn-helix domain-containing protein [Cytobacillus firmus]|uniref:helix-turn-helix domain-containing protein n=1 Tax=Cytobacillus firmus TaxID=1399 RepID=UPI0036BE69CC